MKKDLYLNFTILCHCEISEHRGKERIWKASRERKIIGPIQRTQTRNDIRILSSHTGSQETGEQCFQSFEEKWFPIQHSVVSRAGSKNEGRIKAISDIWCLKSSASMCSLQETAGGRVRTNEEVTQNGIQKVGNSPGMWGREIPATYVEARIWAVEGGLSWEFFKKLK